jgi:hypothetical protein
LLTHRRPPSHRRNVALTLTLVCTAAAVAAGACSSSKGGAGTAPLTQAEVTTIVDETLQTTQDFIAKSSATVSAQVSPLKPEGLELGSVTLKCSTSGSVQVVFSTDGVAVTYNNCDMGSFYLDGSLTIGCVSSGSTITETFNGVLDEETFSSSGAVEQQGQWQYSDLTVTFSSGAPAIVSGSVSYNGAVVASGTLDVDAGSAPTCPVPPADGGLEPFDSGPVTLDGGGLCGTSPTGCSISLCAAGTDCTGSGIAASIQACDTVVAQYDQASGDTTIPILNCTNPSDGPQVGIDFAGTPTTGTFTGANPSVSGGAICAGVIGGTSWVASLGPAAGEDGGVLGSFSVTITSVSQVSSGDTTTQYFVHGSVTAQCYGAATENDAAVGAGTVAMTVTF